jgi:hypothetical protein
MRRWLKHFSKSGVIDTRFFVFILIWFEFSANEIGCGLDTNAPQSALT